MSVLQTTFFAAIESQMLDIIDPDASTMVDKTAVVTLSSALIVHLFAGT